MKIKDYSDMDSYRLASHLKYDAATLTTSEQEDSFIYTSSDNIFTDHCGTVWKSVENTWPIPAPIGRTIKNRADFKAFKIPDGSKEHIFQKAREVIEKNNEYLVTMGTVCGPFTQISLILGIKKFSEFSIDDPEFITELLNRSKDFGLQLIEGYKKIGTDIILIGDDLGFASGTFFSPNWYKKNLFPLFDELIKSIKKNNMHGMLHCDGNINALLEDLVELGFDGLNPLERKSNMDLRQLRNKFGSRITFSGNVDSSTTLVFGTPEDVKKETLQCILDGGLKGAYILSTDHSFHDDIPNQNIMTMIDTCKKFGTYPIDTEKINKIINNMEEMA